MATTNDLKNGTVLRIDGQLWAVVEFQHVKPGKGGAFVRTKLKNVLSGKVVDTNSPFLAKELRELGVDLERIVVIPDVVETIAREVRAMSEAYDHVFTSGGVGPTHDDLTMDGVAAAFGIPLAVNEIMAKRIERAQGRPPNESQLKMAMIPEGSSLVDAGDLWFPVVIVENVYVFPGVPELLRKKFDSIRDRFRGEPFLLKNVYVKRRESDIAAELNDLLREFPELLLGSYPKIGEEGFHQVLRHVAATAKEFGDVMTTVAEAWADQRISDNELNRIKTQCLELIGALQGMLVLVGQINAAEKPAHLRAVS